MTTFYFLLSILFVMYEINVLSRTADSLALSKRMKDKEFWRSETEKDIKSRGCLVISMNMIFMMWTVLGIALATQWQIFMLLFSGAIVNKLISKITAENDLVIVKRIDAVISIVILLWIFMNHFHPGFFPHTLI